MQYTLSQSDVRLLRQMVRAYRGGGTTSRPVARRRRGRGGSGGNVINIIHGQAVGAVNGGNFSIDHILVRNGADPRDDTDDPLEAVLVDNPFGFVIADNGLVRAEQGDDGVWDAVQAVCPAAGS